MRDLTIGITLGIAVWLISLLVPFRQFVARPQIAWDVFGASFAFAVLSLVTVPLDALVARADEFIGGWAATIEAAPPWSVVLGYLFAADLGAYLTHRALHLAWLWPTHAWHHSPRYLYWLAGLRGSPIHVIGLLIPYWLAFMLFPVPDAALVGTLVAVLETGNQHLIHSNIRIPFARHVEYIFVTPRFHFAHHNRKREIANSNYGFIFSFWDRLFGTYTDPDTVPADAALGIDYEISNWRLLLGLRGA